MGHFAFLHLINHDNKALERPGFSRCGPVILDGGQVTSRELQSQVSSAALRRNIGFQQTHGGRPLKRIVDWVGEVWERMAAKFHSTDPDDWWW